MDRPQPGTRQQTSAAWKAWGLTLRELTQGHTCSSKAALIKPISEESRPHDLTVGLPVGLHVSGLPAVLPDPPHLMKVTRPALRDGQAISLHLPFTQDLLAGSVTR